MIKTAILTISDKGYKGYREDITGLTIGKMIEAKKEYTKVFYKIIPDEKKMIEKELITLCDSYKVDLVLTNGGTGFSRRDVTPEATKEVIEKFIPGIGEAMRNKSLEITPRAMLSRGIAGIRKDTVIVNLPGSPKGARENLSFILHPLVHGIYILKGKEVECAR